MLILLRLVLALAAWSFYFGFSGVAFADDMRFGLVVLGDPGQCGNKCLQMISAKGEIVSSTPDDFLKFVSEHAANRSVRAVVLFDSPGGEVNASLKLGLILRKLGAATVVSDVDPETGAFGIGHCYSACVYALMGGRKRVIPPGSRVGIHRAYTIAVGPDPSHGGGTHDNSVNLDPGTTADVIARYSDQMGVSRDLIETAQQTMPESIHIVTPQEARRWRLGVPNF